MGTFLSVPFKLQESLNKLSGNAFQVYLLFLRCVKFKPRTRTPVNGTEIFEYSYKKAKNYGYNKSGSQFRNGVKELIFNKYVIIIRRGYFQGKTGGKKCHQYRLLKL